MRARLLKPGFFTDQKLARLPMGARLLFAGLWCLADREGRLIDSPRWIGGQVFPHDDGGIDAEVPVWIAALESAGFILRYSVDGCKYIQVRNFRKHQTVNQREAASEIPAPPEWLPREEQAVREPSVKEQPTVASGTLPREEQAGREPDLKVQPEVREFPRKEPVPARVRSRNIIERVNGADVAAILAKAGVPLSAQRSSSWPQHLTPIREALREHATAIGRERDLDVDVDIGRRIAEAAGGNPARAAAYIAKHSLRHFGPRAVRRRPWPRSFGFWVAAMQEAAANGNGVQRSKPPPYRAAAERIA